MWVGGALRVLGAPTDGSTVSDRAPLRQPRLCTDRGAGRSRNAELSSETSAWRMKIMSERRARFRKKKKK